jgi:hypothetical protein
MTHRSVVVLVVACLLGVMLACGGIDAPPPKPITRQEFKLKVLGKTEAEVIKAVGPPQTKLVGQDTAEWIYPRRTIDPTTQKIYDSVSVEFDRKKGKVSSVTFQ